MSCDGMSTSPQGAQGISVGADGQVGKASDKRSSGPGFDSRRDTAIGKSLGQALNSTLPLSTKQ